MAQEQAKGKYTAINIIMVENPSYESLHMDLENKFMMGEDKYPTSLTEAYNTIIHWKSTYTGEGRTCKVNPEGHMSFLQNDDDE